MSRQLPPDCLNEIFEYLEESKVSLHSCLLVNRQWCEISVRILWRNIWNYKRTFLIEIYEDVELKILQTLVSCLPDDSKDFLFENSIFNENQNWERKPPTFNYAEFCRVLSIHEIDDLIHSVLVNQKSSTPQLSLSYNIYLISQEIFKMFMKQIPSLKELNYISADFVDVSDVPNITFIHFSGAKDCLKNLTVLNCNSNVHSEFFYQLSQICHLIHSLIIEFDKVISNGLTDLILVQRNLRYLKLSSYYEDLDWTNIIPSLTKHSHTLTKVKIAGREYYKQISFISSYTNLKELIFSCDDDLEDFKDLQFVTFSQLRILKFCYGFPNYEMIIKFLENNGKNLEELSIKENHNLLKLAVARLCPNLKRFFIMFNKDELETLKIIFDGCQKLESMKFWCRDNERFLNKNEMFEVIAKYSPKNFHELKLYYIEKLKLLPEDLESFFINWKNRKPQKLLSFIVVKNYIKDISKTINKENMEVINKYMKLDVIRKVCIEKF